MSNPMRFVDKDGKQTDFPPVFFGQAENTKASIIHQKIEPMMVEAARPSAISMSLGVSLAAGLAGGGCMSNTYFLKGQDEKTLNTYNTTEVGAGLPGGDISLGLNFIFFKAILLHLMPNL